MEQIDSTTEVWLLDDVDDWTDLEDPDEMDVSPSTLLSSSVTHSYVSMLRSDDEEAQQAALRSLQAYGPRAGGSELLKEYVSRLMSGEPAVREAAAETAGCLGRIAAQNPALIESLRVRLFDANNVNVRVAAARALYQLIVWLRDDVALSLDLRTAASKDSDKRVRAWALGALTPPASPVTVFSFFDKFARSQMASRNIWGLASRFAPESPHASEFVSQFMAHQHSGIPREGQVTIGELTFGWTIESVSVKQIPDIAITALEHRYATQGVENTNSDLTLLYLSVDSTDLIGSVALVNLADAEGKLDKVCVMFHDTPNEESLEEDESFPATYTVAILPVPDSMVSVEHVDAPFVPGDAEANDVDRLWYAREAEVQRNPGVAPLWDNWFSQTEPGVREALNLRAGNS